MGYKGNDRPIFGKWLCWTLPIGAFSCAVYQMCVTVVALVIVIYDEIDRDTNTFEIPQRFKPEWRQHVWEGWLATTVWMLVVHTIIIIMTAFYIWYLRGDFPLYVRIHYAKWYVICLIGYMVSEIGIAVYQYSWYGLNTCRLAFNCSEFLFWILRTIGTTISLLCYISLRQDDIRQLYTERPYTDFHSMASSQMQLMPAMSAQQYQPYPQQMYPMQGVGMDAAYTDQDMDTV